MCKQTAAEFDVEGAYSGGFIAAMSRLGHHFNSSWAEFSFDTLSY